MPAGVNEEYAKEIGRAIAGARTLRGLNQVELGEKTGNSKNAVSNWERGESAPTAQNLRTLCKVLGVQPDQLLCMNGSTSPPADQTAAEQLLGELTSLCADVERAAPDLISALKKAEETARSLAEK